MAWSSNHTSIQKPLFQRYLKIACLIISFLLAIGGLVALGFLPMYISNKNESSPKSFDIPPLNVSYALPDSSFLSTRELDLSAIDLEKMARSFESSLGLKVKNFLQIKSISLTTGVGITSKTRRKRLIQCERDIGGLSGPVLVFDFNFTYPIHRLCQTQQCVIQVYKELYQIFRSNPSISINFNDVMRDLRLCSAGVITHILQQTGTSTVSTTRKFTTTPPTSNTSQSTTNKPYVTSNTIIPSNVTTENPQGASRTSIRSSVTFSTTERAQVTSQISHREDAKLSTSVTSNLTSNNLNSCLNEFRMTQETVPPYRINATSTLFFQDNHTILIVGASKFETKIDNEGLKIQLKINGVVVYKNCQRTIDVSLPIISSFSA